MAKNTKSKGLSSFNTGLILLVVIALAVSGIIWFSRTNPEPTTRGNSGTNNTNRTTNTTPNEPEPVDQVDSSITIKDSVLLDVPFTPQAPTANWDELHNEACEEASAIMVAEYFKGNRIETLEPSFVESQITSLTEYQDENFGYHLSINTAETMKMIEDNYGLDAEIVRNFTENDLKRILSEGKLIVLPADGRLLENPNFKDPGPIYHMLVIVGYDKKGFITNDPGTRKGRHYRYSYETLHDSTGEWVAGAHATNTQKKQAIIVSQ